MHAQQGIPGVLIPTHVKTCSLEISVPLSSGVSLSINCCLVYPLARCVCVIEFARKASSLYNGLTVQICQKLKKKYVNIVFQNDNPGIPGGFFQISQDCREIKLFSSTIIHLYNLNPYSSAITIKIGII